MMFKYLNTTDYCKQRGTKWSAEGARWMNRSLPQENPAAISDNLYNQ